mgnify:FL=1
MAIHDPIGDFLTIIRNGSNAKRETVTCQHSKVRESLCQIFKDEGYIGDYRVLDEASVKQLEISLKYVNETAAITGLERKSKPGRRVYYGYQEIPRVLGGLGIAILTTSKGVMRAREARKNKVGGELICNIW